MSIGKVVGSGGAVFDPRQKQAATPLAPQEVGKEHSDKQQRLVHPETPFSKLDITEADETRLIKRMTEMLNESAQYTHKWLRFRLHEDTDRLIVQVLDAETLEVIREIPPEELLDLASRIHEMIGLFIDEWA